MTRSCSFRPIRTFNDRFVLHQQQSRFKFSVTRHNPFEMGSRFRMFTRAFRSTRVARGGGGEGAPWGTEVNEPGGRLFGEAILKPGERRELFDWEVPYIGTMLLSVVILAVGLNSRPDTNPSSWAHQEAERRLATLEALSDQPQSSDDE